MRTLLLMLIGLICAMCSCKDTDRTGFTESDLPSYTGQDSARMKTIQAYVDSVNANRKNFERIQLQPNFSSEDDKLLVFKKGDEVVLARLDEIKEDSETREYFFRKDGKLVNYQLMYWSKKTMPPYAWGINIFMDDQGIAFAQERYVELSTDERPARLLAAPPMDPKVNVDSMARVGLQRWQPVEAAILKKP